MTGMLGVQTPQCTQAVSETFMQGPGAITHNAHLCGVNYGFPGCVEAALVDSNAGSCSFCLLED